MPPSTLQRYARMWGLRPLGRLTPDRPTSQIHKVVFEGRPAVLKLLTPLGAEDERHGATALACWAGAGAARLYRSDAGAHLLEFIDGGDCVALVRAGRDAEASARLGAAMARLHAAYPGPAPGGLTPLDARFSELFTAAERPGAEPILARGADMARALLDAPLNTTLLHGDLHHENLLCSSERGWLAIDPKGLIGETTYDGAMAVLNPMGFDGLTEAPDRVAGMVRILAEQMAVPEDRLLCFAFAHACLSASWSMETPAFSSSHALRMARVIEGML